MISDFRGRYRFLSNFSYANVTYEGVQYVTIEHAYQAAKSSDPVYRIDVWNASTASKAKQLGKRVKLRPDWEAVKLDIMLDLVRQKFRTSIVLRNWLLETGDEELVEGNHWGDTFWGVCNGVGENHLGKILMKVRGELLK